jgi:hypothetical protein
MDIVCIAYEGGDAWPALDKQRDMNVAYTILHKEL